MKVAKYTNLKAELCRIGMTQAQLAEYMYLSDNSISKKITGKTNFMCDEMWYIKNTFFPELTIDYLFTPYHD